MLGIDDGYAAYAGVFLTSIALNNWQDEIVCHIGCSNALSSKNKERLAKFDALYKNFSLQIYDLSSSIEVLPPLSSQTAKRFSKAVLARLLLPAFLPPDVQRVIYMDCDMLCLGSIRSLWQTDLGGKIAAACAYNEVHGPRQIERLGLLRAEHYYNSGLFLLDVEKWRSHHFTELAVECYSKFHEFFVMPDQDVLNVLLQGQIKRLDDCYNRMLLVNDIASSRIMPGDVLVHFVNEVKPWFIGNAENIAHLYKRYVAASLWYDLPFLEPQEVQDQIKAGDNLLIQGKAELAAHLYGKAAKTLFAEYQKNNPVEYF